MEESKRPHVNIGTIGHVDHSKNTLMEAIRMAQEIEENKVDEGGFEMIKGIKKLILALCCVAIPLSVIPCTTSGFDRKFWWTTWVPWTWVPWTSKTQEDNLIHTVRIAINRVLGMLAFVSLILCLYAGFRMMTSGWDSKQYTAWVSILKNAGIWLAIIGVSWLIVSLVFYVLNWTIQVNWW